MEIEKIIENKENLLEFLKEKGFTEETDYSDEDYKEGTFFKIDKRKLLVVYEIVDEEKLKEIKDHFLIDRGLSYCIIVFNNKLIFYRTFGETKHFIYSERTKNNVSKKDKLENIKDFNSIFQSKDISALFYEGYKLKRNLLVQHIKNDIQPTQKYLIAQKIFDRFFFIYFLCHKGIIKFEDGGKISGENLFSRILLKEKDFLKNLKKLFHLFNSQEKNIFEIKDYKIVIPYLNGGLFRPDVLEQDLDISLKNTDWETIFDFLNGYHWIIEDVKASEENEDKILTPEILGHVYERSVVEWEQVGFEQEAEKVVKKVTERKKKGVYYTPESITDYISNNTIVPYLLDKLENQYNSFEELIKSKNKRHYKKALEILSEIKILDPACGSGAFLIKASEIIYFLKRRLLHELKQKQNFYDLKLDLITENIYGVDILSGAIEISKLRLWLWLISDFEESKNEIKALPNIEYNLKVGNSLIGWLDEKLTQLPVNTPLTEKVDGIFTGLIAFSENGDEEELKKARDLLKGYKLNDYIEAYYTLYKIYRQTHGLKAENLRSILETIRKSIYSTVTPAFLEYINKKIKPKYDTRKPPITKEEFDKLQVFHWRIDFGHIILNGGFDIIVGNPPYGDSVLDKLQLNILKAESYKSLKKSGKDGGSKNGASLFIEKSSHLLNKKGYFAFIVPNSITRVKQFEKIRLFLLSDVNLLEIVDEGAPFKDVTLEMVTLIYNKKQNNKVKIKIKRENLPIKINLREYTVDKRIFMKYKQFIIYHDKLFDKIYKKSNINCFNAIRGGDLEKSSNKNKVYNIPHLYSGKSVHKYYIDFSNIDYVSNKAITKKTAKYSYNNSFLISTKIYPFPRAIIKPLHYTIGAGIIKIDTIIDGLYKKYSLAVLNSKLIMYVCYRYLVNFSQLTTNLNTGQLPLIPIKLISENEQKPFIDLVEEILSITKSKDYEENKQKQKEVKKLQDKIDKLVYELYGLTEDEIKIIEEFSGK